MEMREMIEHYIRMPMDDFYTKLSAIDDKNSLRDANNGDSLLHIASRYTDTEAVKILLDAGMEADTENKYGETPLWQLAKLRNYSIKPEKGAVYALTVMLLDAGASAMKKDDEGNMCYHHAAKDGNGEFCKALFDKGVRLTRTDGRGNNGLHLASEYVYNTVKDLESAKKRLSDRQNDPRSSQELIADGAMSVEKAEEKLEGFFVAAKAFYDAGVDPEDKNNMEETAKVLAVRNGGKKISLLLSGDYNEEEDSDLKTRSGGMTMFEAVSDKEALLALIELGEDVNQMEDDGKWTPLGKACHIGDLEAVKTLLENGADPNIKAGNGRTPAFWLFTRNPHNTYKEIPTSGIIDALISAGMDIDGLVDDSSRTILNWACATDDMGPKIPSLKALLKHGADPNSSDMYGMTPLMYVSVGAGFFDEEISNAHVLLLEKGSKVDAKDRNGNTPLIYAVSNRRPKLSMEMCENLFDFGDPDINAVNNEGMTALDIAARTDNTAAVKFLLNRS